MKKNVSPLDFFGSKIETASGSAACSIFVSLFLFLILFWISNNQQIMRETLRYIPALFLLFLMSRNNIVAFFLTNIVIMFILSAIFFIRKRSLILTASLLIKSILFQLLFSFVFFIISGFLLVFVFGFGPAA
jgi:hypothetical protein